MARINPEQAARLVNASAQASLPEPGSPTGYMSLEDLNQKIFELESKVKVGKKVAHEVEEAEEL